MNTPTKTGTNGLGLLRTPFAAHQISKLPKESRAQSEERKADKSKIVWRCEVCGGMHHKNAVHLDYVGHAALTDRLLDADPAWSWEPMALDQNGLPAFDRNGGLWIKLTVLGVSRFGYGDAEGKTGGNAVKEAIGDALRNAAMRFGAALDLWHKGELHVEEPDDAASADKPGEKPKAGKMSDASWAKLTSLLQATNTQPGVLIDFYKVKDLRALSKADYEAAVERLETRLAVMAKAETNKRQPGPREEFAAIDAADVPF